VTAGELVFDDGQVQLWHGRFQDVLPALGIHPDVVLADPPYGETSLEWDRWPVGWPALVAEHASSMWCFGSMRMFLDRRDEFAGWQMSQDVVWEKQNGTGATGDRFLRVHEHAVHWYRGPWAEAHHDVPRTAGQARPAARIRERGTTPHRGMYAASGYEYSDTRMARSVIYARNMHGRGAIHPTEKPQGLLEPLVVYGCPPGGLVLDVFAGSSSTLLAARNTGRRAIGIEMRAEQCELAVRRLEQGVLTLEGL
jgi:site-specific DNA-methyltransferase (adenine-specific)